MSSWCPAVLARNAYLISSSQQCISLGCIKHHHQLRIDGIGPQVLAQDDHSRCFLWEDTFIVCLCIMFCVFPSHMVFYYGYIYVRKKNTNITLGFDSAIYVSNRKSRTQVSG